MNEHLLVEEQIIGIFLSNKDSVKYWSQSNFGLNYFDEHNQDILAGIIYALNNDVQLTRQTYKDFLLQFKKLTPEQVASQISLYNRCLMHLAKKDDLPMLLEKVKLAYVRRKTTFSLNEYKSEKDKLGDIGANRSLIEKLAALEADTSESKIGFLELHKSHEQFMDDLLYRRANPASRLTCGIREIDLTMNVGFKKGHLTIFSADVGSFKCGRDKELCQIEDGTYLSFEELFNLYNNGVNHSLLSVDSKNKLYLQKILHIQSNGKKKCFKVKTVCGFSVDVTANHPILTFNGFKKTEELKSGDIVGIARSGIFGKNKIDRSLAIWLGCMYSDGGTSQIGYNFTNEDDIIVSAMKKCSSNLKGELVHIPNQKFYGRYRVNGLRNIGVEYGIDGKLTIEKSIHKSVYSWDKESLVFLLQSMYGCDGSFSKSIGKRKTRHQIIYHTSSKQLAIDVQNLLLKFGIVGRIFTFMSEYKRKDGSYFKREAYRVYISDASQVAKFIKEIGFLGKKQKIAKKSLKRIEKIALCENPNIDLIPSDVWDIVEKKFVNGKTNHGCRRFLKGKNANRSNCPPIWARKTSGVSRSKLRKIAEYLDNDKELLQICDADIFWDKIVSIESSGYHQTYDIAMPKDHNFVANNIVTHNSTIMLNVALNIFKATQENILFIPLEMPGTEILQKIVSRETRIPNTMIEHAHLLKDNQITQIKQEMEKWLDLRNKFCIMEMGCRAKLSLIRREIEKRINYFQPRMVFIDYADNLIPDKRYTRSDLEMNDILEDMRQMGQNLDFGVVTAAQLARDALKKQKEVDESKQSLGSTDIRGGQVMTANADTVYGQLRDPAQPNAKLKFFCIKSRHGQSVFKNGRNNTTLQVQADIGLIHSEEDVEFNTSVDAEEAQMITKPPSEDDPY